MLDLQQGVCFGMTHVGDQIWELLKNKQSIVQICEHLCTEYPQISREHITKDVTEFVQELHANRLVSDERLQPNFVRLPKLLAVIERCLSGLRPKRKPRRTRCLFWKALLGLAAFDLFRFGSNFPRIHEFVRDWKVSSEDVRQDVSDRVCTAVNDACVWYPKRVLCLQRSFVTTCLLRHCGFPAQMVMGAQKFPFKAHAWTEVNGRPVNERRDVQRIYLVWERC